MVPLKNRMNKESKSFVLRAQRARLIETDEGRFQVELKIKGLGEPVFVTDVYADKVSYTSAKHARWAIRRLNKKTVIEKD